MRNLLKITFFLLALLGTGLLLLNSTLSTTSCGVSDEVTTQGNVSWNAINNVYSFCNYPVSCNGDYTNFYLLTNSTTYEGTYYATILVTGETSHMEWEYDITPGSTDDNNVDVSGSACDVIAYDPSTYGQITLQDYDGYEVYVTYPRSEAFTIELTLTLTCGDCGASPGTAVTFYSVTAFGEDVIGDLGPLAAPTLLGNNLSCP